jgi:hypothetical protein
MLVKCPDCGAMIWNQRRRMTRKEHLEWAKRRALEYLDADQPENAVASMVSDLGKHEDLKCPPELAMIGMLEINNRERLRKWILGFNSERSKYEKKWGKP